ncbi:MAG: oligosaccharide flippase family protein [Candidatus Moranbacteria bacterium]|nr:oligosaccharide flippase family protein [Candidatus Moranbacteria bacterium]
MRVSYLKNVLFFVWSKETIKNSVWVSLRYGIVSAIGLLLSVAFARLATKEVLGQYQVILSIIAFFSIASLPGLNTSALRSVARNESGTVKQAVRLSFISSILAIPVLVGYGIYLLQMSGGQSTDVGVACIVLGALLPFLYASNTWYVFYEGKLLFRSVSIKIIFSTAVIALCMYAALWYRLSAFWLALIWFSLNALFSWLYYWQVSIQEDQESDTRGKIDIRYGLGLSAQKFVVNLTDNFPVMAIAFFIGYEAVATYQVASGFVVALTGLLAALTAMSLPLIFSQTKEDFKSIFIQNVLMGLLGSLGYFVVVKLFFILLYGDGFSESYAIAKQLWLLPFFISIRLFLVNIFTARQKNKLIVGSYLLVSISSLFLLFYIVQRASFTASIAYYLYFINGALIAIFSLAYYFSKASKKTDSIC